MPVEIFVEIFLRFLMKSATYKIVKIILGFGTISATFIKSGGQKNES